VDGYGSGEEAM
jgi:hypothetical protein